MLAGEEAMSLWRKELSKRLLRRIPNKTESLAISILNTPAIIMRNVKLQDRVTA